MFLTKSKKDKIIGYILDLDTTNTYMAYMMDYNGNSIHIWSISDYNIY